MTIQMQWGAIPVRCDNERFARAFLQRRAWYFEFYQTALTAGEVLHDDDLLRLVAVQDKVDGTWRLDEFDSVEELLGAFLGYTSGLLHPEDIPVQETRRNRQERDEREAIQRAQ